MLSGDHQGGIPIFSGTERVSLDEKGRVLFAKRKRDDLGRDFVLAQSEIGVIAAYPRVTWMEMIREVLQYPTINPGRSKYGRLMVADAQTENNFDTPGRIVIPAALRKIGNMTDKLVIVGNVEKVEIWSEQEWEKFKKDEDSYGMDRLNKITDALRQMRDWA
ncbi:division/cell wall cluster transcriptional repressor MraZ [soil metagenome]